MKAKLRKEQKAKNKQNKSISINESRNQSQSQNPPENENIILNNQENNNNKEIVENNNNDNIQVNNISEKDKEDEIKTLKKELIPKQLKKQNTDNNIISNKQINIEEYKVEELSKIATMFNFEIDNDKKMIKINENEEYYDMRKQIQELELELSKAQKEYNDLILYNKRKTEKQKEYIEELENDLKKQVNYNIENLKKENIILLRDVNLLDKKLDSITTLYQKEKYDMNSTINELDNVIKKTNEEIFYVEDLKMRLKNLNNKDIPQDLLNSINFNLKDDNDDIKDITNTSKFGKVRSKTGSIPISDILDVSSFDSKSSKRSVKKIYV
jgi:hypothetical protein